MREMKDSGHETIGLVPSDWTEKRLKYLCKIQTGNEDTQNANPEGKYPFYVRSPIVEHCDRYTFDGEGILVAGDGAGAGRIFHHVYGKYAVHQRVYRLSHFAGNADFIYYYLSNLFPHEMDKGSAQSTVPSMRLPMLLNFPLFLPSKKEQDKIVTFLDSKCSEIDAISADIQKEIETLEQYKRSVITEAVTKGLNPDVEMKDSGIEWVGNIPAHWDVQKNKRLFVEVNNKCLATDNYTLLSVSEYYGVAPRNEKIKDGDFETRAESLNGYKICRKGDIVMNIMLAWKKATARTAYDGIVSPAYCVYRGKGIETSYYHYVFRTNGCADYFGLHSTGIIDSRLRLYTDAFFNLNSPVPPIDEQKNIATYLDSKCEEIESIIAIKKKQMETLSSYKKSLIYEYVTGKKEVPTYES